MSGSWATGSDTSDSRPARVTMIETTNAKRGRSTKVREIIAARSAARRARHDRFLHDLTGPNLLDAFDDDVVAGRNSRLDHDVHALVRAGLDPALHDTMVLVDDQRVVTRLIDQQRRLRDHELL